MSKEHARNTLTNILSGFMASASDSVNIASDQNVSIQLIETGKSATSIDSKDCIILLFRQSQRNNL